MGSPGSPLRNKVVGRATPQPGGLWGPLITPLKNLRWPEGTAKTRKDADRAGGPAFGVVAAQHGRSGVSMVREMGGLLPPGASAVRRQAIQLSPAALGGRHSCTTKNSQAGGRSWRAQQVQLDAVGLVGLLEWPAAAQVAPLLALVQAGAARDELAASQACWWPWRCLLGVSRVFGGRPPAAAWPPGHFASPPPPAASNRARYLIRPCRVALAAAALLSSPCCAARRSTWPGRALALPPGRCAAALPARSAAWWWRRHRLMVAAASLPPAAAPPAGWSRCLPRSSWAAARAWSSSSWAAARAPRRTPAPTTAPTAPARRRRHSTRPRMRRSSRAAGRTGSATFTRWMT